MPLKSPPHLFHRHHPSLSQKKHSDHSSQLQKLIELTQQLLESSRRRERDSVPDLERNPDVHRSGFFEFQDKESIWARTKKWKIEKVTVMTEEEMKQDPLLVDKLIATREFAEIEKNWNDLWPRLIDKTSQDVQLQILIAFLCQRSTTDYLGYLPETIDNLYLRAKIPRKVDLAISRSYLEFVETRILSSRHLWVLKHLDTLKFFPIFKILLDTVARGTRKRTVGHILFECYRRRILEQPEIADLDVYRRHTVMVMYIANVLDHLYEHLFWLEEVEHTVRNQIAENLLGLNVHDAIHLIRQRDSSYRDQATGSTFRADDLNIDSLRSIGELEIRWTGVLENHLLLDLSTKQLHVCWFVGLIGELACPIQRWLS